MFIVRPRCVIPLLGRVWLGLFLVLGFLGGIPRAQAAETVVLQLKWRHQFQFAGYYAAVAQGYYRDAEWRWSSGRRCRAATRCRR